MRSASLFLRSINWPIWLPIAASVSRVARSVSLVWPLNSSTTPNYFLTKNDRKAKSRMQVFARRDSDRRKLSRPKSLIQMGSFAPILHQGSPCPEGKRSSRLMFFKFCARCRGRSRQLRHIAIMFSSVNLPQRCNPPSEVSADSIQKHRRGLIEGRGLRENLSYCMLQRESMLVALSPGDITGDTGEVLLTVTLETHQTKVRVQFPVHSCGGREALLPPRRYDLCRCQCSFESRLDERGADIRASTS